LFRLALISGSVPAGLAAGLLAWLAAGGESGSAEALPPIAAQLGDLRVPAGSGQRPRSALIAELAERPLFALTTGPGAIREPVVRLVGVALTRERSVALLVIDGKPAQWMRLGETRDGVTVQDVQSARVVVETLVGSRDLALGEQSGEATASTAAASAAVEPTVIDKIPSGFRSPPPPADAPKAQ